MKFKLNKKCICCQKAPSKKKNSISLKKLPVTDLFVKNSKSLKGYSLDQDIIFCNRCEHMFLKNHITPEYIYNQDYGLCSSKTYSSIQANEDFFNFINSNLGKSNIKKIIEVGSNDLYLLKKFYRKNRSLVGIDPVVKRDKEYAKIKVIKEFFNKVDNKKLGKDSDLIICGHTLEHVENPDFFLKKILSISEKKTKIFFQFPSLESLILNMSFDQIHHQHLNYFSLNSFNKILKKYGGKIINYAFNEFHYGALMIYFTLNSSKNKTKKKINLLPKINFIQVSEAYNNFKNHLKSQEKTINNYLKRKRKFYVVAAGALLPILNYHMNGIINKANGILDDDKNKIGKYFPNINTKILQMKSTSLKGSVCLIGCVHSHVTTRKIINILIQKRAEIILLPTITF